MCEVLFINTNPCLVTTYLGRLIPRYRDNLHVLSAPIDVFTGSSCYQEFFPFCYNVFRLKKPVIHVSHVIMIAKSTYPVTSSHNRYYTLHYPLVDHKFHCLPPGVNNYHIAEQCNGEQCGTNALDDKWWSFKRGWYMYSVPRLWNQLITRRLNGLRIHSTLYLHVCTCSFTP